MTITEYVLHTGAGVAPSVQQLFLFRAAGWYESYQGRCQVSREASEIWTEDLTDKQLKMLIASGEDQFGSGYGVELHGGNWKTATSLERLGLGWIEGGQQRGSDLPGLFFNNAEGVRILQEFED